MARRGEAVEMTAVVVSLHSATVEQFDPPLVDVSLTCSSGFYVRSLADSLGRRLGCGACLDALRRTASGSFGLTQAIPLAQLEESPGWAMGQLVPAERALLDFPAVTLTPEGVTRTLHGNDIGAAHLAEREVPEGAAVQLFTPEGRLLAIARPARPGFLHPAVVLG